MLLFRLLGLSMIVFVLTAIFVIIDGIVAPIRANRKLKKTLRQLPDSGEARVSSPQLHY